MKHKHPQSPIKKVESKSMEDYTDKVVRVPYLGIGSNLDEAARQLHKANRYLRLTIVFGVLAALFAALSLLLMYL
jgi:hypothetical protein